MPAYFFDSSALVKFYVEESGAAWVRSFTDTEENIIHVSSVAEVETVSALTRRLNSRDINKAEFEEACDDLQQDFATQLRHCTTPTINEAGAGPPGPRYLFADVPRPYGTWLFNVGPPGLLVAALRTLSEPPALAGGSPRLLFAECLSHHLPSLSHDHRRYTTQRPLPRTSLQLIA